MRDNEMDDRERSRPGAMGQSGSGGTRPKLLAASMAVVCLAAGALILLAAQGLSNNISFDETYNLQVPRSLLKGRGYGTAQYGQLLPYDYNITTGPTVMLPAAAVMKLFGPTVQNARLVILGYALLFLLAGGLLLNRLGGVLPALILMVFFLKFTLHDNSIRFLGEVPGLAFTMLALAAYFFLDRRAEWTRGLIVGLLLGLAILTKLQWVLLGAPVLACAVFEFSRKKWRNPWLVALPVMGLPLLLFYAVQAVDIGWAAMQNNIESLRRFQSTCSESQDVAALLERLSAIPRTELILDALALLGAMGLLGGPIGPKAKSVLVFLGVATLTNFIWWEFLSRGHGRYALMWRPLAATLLAAVCGMTLYMMTSLTRNPKVGQFLRGAALTVMIGVFAWTFQYYWVYYGSSVLRHRAVYREQLALAGWARTQAEQGRIICGVGWWMPWDVSFLADIDVYDLLTPGRQPEAEAFFIQLPPYVRDTPEGAARFVKARKATPAFQVGETRVFSLQLGV